MWTNRRIILLPKTTVKNPDMRSSYTGGPTEQNAIALLLHRPLNRQCHREISLPRSCYANAEDNVLLLNRLDVFTLRGRLRRYLFLTRRIETSFGEIVVQTESAIFGYLCESFAQLFVGKGTAFPEKL